MGTTRAGMLRRLQRLAELARETVRAAGPRLARPRADPARVMEQTGMQADPWQRDLLRSHFNRGLLLCTRQAGKSTVAAANRPVSHPCG